MSCHWPHHLLNDLGGRGEWLGAMRRPWRYLSMNPDRLVVTHRRHTHYSHTLYTYSQSHTYRSNTHSHTLLFALTPGAARAPGSQSPSPQPHVIPFLKFKVQSS